MAGYNGRPGNAAGTNEFINATAFNSQITRQRDEYILKNQTSAPNHLSLGVSSDSTQTLFSSFVPEEIMVNADLNFLEGSVSASDNPDFTSEQNIETFKNFNTIKSEAELTKEDDAPDGPGIGIGPKLSTNDIDAAMNGTLSGSFESNGNDRGRGFGWYSESHETTTIGSYFTNRYDFGIDRPADGDELAIKGERIDTRLIDYKQDSDSN